MCDEWRNNYSAFRLWAREHGFKQGLQIDRINNSKGYEPSNCRFVTCKMNCYNRSKAVKFPDGKSSTDIAKELGMSRGAIRNRVRNMALSLKQASTMPRVPNGIERTQFWKRTGLWKDETPPKPKP